jgi:AcrR family transcriptional regulator
VIATRHKSRASSAQPYHHGDLRRALLDAALEIVTEEQDWAFSLREVARRAGVSHNAPYNHFGDKRDLLAAVAAEGFETLRKHLLAASAGIERADKALRATARAYVLLGVENPAHYRLMFGSTLVTAGQGLPAEVKQAGAGATRVLEEIIDRGARAGELAVAPSNPAKLKQAVFAAWSTVHGTTMLLIDGLTGARSPKVGVLADAAADAILCGLLPR